MPFGGAADCERAIDAARAAFDGWSRATAYERAAVLEKAAAIIRADLDALAHTTVRESGKPLLQARGEWAATADMLEWFAEEGKRAYGRVIPSRSPTKRMLVLKQPIGVVGLITAWNFPAWNIARAGGAALAAGCPIVVRPSEYTPLTGMNLVRMLADAGAPPGVVNLVNGDPGPMGQAMLAHPAVAKIHFTGSTRVGRLLMDGASKTITRLSLELGGNAPVLVFPDVDLDQVVAGATAAKFRNGGQVCVVAAALPGRPRRGAGVCRRRSPPRSATLRVGAGTRCRPPRSGRSSTPGSATASRRWSPARGPPARGSPSAAPARRTATRATSTSRPWSPTSPRRRRSTARRSSARCCR